MAAAVAAAAPRAGFVGIPNQLAKQSVIFVAGGSVLLYAIDGGLPVLVLWVLEV